MSDLADTYDNPDGKQPGMVNTAVALLQEDPAAFALQQQSEGVASKLGKMLDIDDSTLETLDGFLNAGIMINLLTNGLNHLQNAFGGFSAGNFNFGGLTGDLNLTNFDASGNEITPGPDAALAKTQPQPSTTPQITPDPTPGGPSATS